MRPFGFQRYGRSEMLLAPGASLPDAPSVLGEEVRPARQDDLGRLAELHREAYRARFDRYLFLEVEDEREDALRAVAEILDGRWGEFLPAGSWIVERAGRPVGAVLSVRSGTGTLIADVMVVPELQGNGVGRRALAAAVRSLRDAGEQRVYLNVTEGNEPALRLYRRFGFVRSLGPTRDWYNARLIPIAPAQGA
jgi:ribosomal protein S18 acetylase RimI-like enzyme